MRADFVYQFSMMLLHALVDFTKQVEMLLRGYEQKNHLGSVGAETLAEAQLARSFIPVRVKLPPDELRRLLKMIRRTGRKDVVQSAARWLASQVRPARRVRGKRHPELLAHRAKPRPVRRI